jgi:hypothetical protein
MISSRRHHRLPLHGTFVLVAALIFGPGLPESVDAQVRYGGHYVQVQESFGGSGGVGLRAGVAVPLLPVEAYAGGEYFFPACSGIGGCGLSGLTLDVNVSLPSPFLAPYATGGWALRRLNPGAAAETFTRSGVSLGAGVGAGLPGARFFGEIRYEFIQIPSRQFVLRFGLMMGG